MPRSPLTSESAVLCGELGSEWLVGVLAPAPDTLSRFVSWNIITLDSRLVFEESHYLSRESIKLTSTVIIGLSA